jgi:succinoglycan biosynthesis transport protein ExoP
VTNTNHNVNRALDAWRRRRWLAVAVFLTVSSTVTTVALSLPNLYRATTTVLVERHQVSEEFVRPSVSAELETRLQTIREDVMSRTRLIDLIGRLGLYPELRSSVPTEALVSRLRRDIELELKSVESQLSGRASMISFTISYGGRDPESVARVANELARLYVDENSTIREGQATRTAEFLKTQLADIRRELEVGERRASAYRATHIGELPQQVETNLASLERLNTQLRLNGENQLRLMDRRDRLERQRLDAAVVSPSAATPSPDAEQLAKLKRDLDDLRRRFTDEYPDVLRIRAELDALTTRAAQHAAPARSAESGASDAAAQASQAIADVSTELAALKEEERMLRQSISGYEQRVENVPKRQQEFEELSRDYDATRERYNTLQKRYEEAQLAATLEQGHNVEQFRILDPALPPRDPSAPNRLRLLALGLIAALGLAVAAVIGAEKLDTSFHAVDELRGFVTIPMLASVPRVESRGEKRRRWRRAALTTVSAAAALLLIVAGARYVAHGNEQMVRMIERSRG